MTSTANPMRFRVGLAQMRSGRDVDANIADAIALIREAARLGAHYVQTPEVTTLMESDPARLLAVSEPEAGNRALEAFAAAARDCGVWLHIGSMGVKLDDRLLANRSYVFTPRGAVAARYDKIHMFDVDLGNGDVYSESATYRPGVRAVLAELPWGPLGLTICYDLRFPALHRALAKGGAKFLAAPAAFTRMTGEAHWHALLRARAIETQSFVFAASQGGRHENGRETYGHSLIISPWGEILAEAGSDPGVVVADIDVAVIDAVRRKIPSLDHDQAFELVTVEAEQA
ncbi:MAG: carbon-nitrogen hydrolase family protein [Hyphomicrobium sp.]